MKNFIAFLLLALTSFTFAEQGVPPAADANIVQYGATCSGTRNAATGTDDSTAWTKALAALPTKGGTIRIPAGCVSYVGTTSFVFTKENIVIQGAGPSSAVVSSVTGGNFVFQTLAGTDTKFKNFDLFLLTTTGAGIKFSEARPNSLVSNMNIYGANQGAVTPAAGSVGVYSAKSTAYSIIRIENSSFNTLFYGVTLADTTTSTQITGSAFQGLQQPIIAGTIGLNIGASGGNFHFAGNTFQGWEKDIYASGSQAFNIVGNSFECGTAPINDCAATLYYIDIFNITRNAFLAGNDFVNWASGVGNNLPTDPAKFVYNIDTYAPPYKGTSPTPCTTSGAASAATTVWQDTCSFTLPAGNWSILGCWNIAGLGAATATAWAFGLSTGTAGNNFSDAVRGDNEFFEDVLAGQTNASRCITWAVAIPFGGATLLQKTQATFGIPGTPPIIYSRISATRNF